MTKKRVAKAPGARKPGRGTDGCWPPAGEEEELGGLHVSAFGRLDARRIDRQLFGRYGRQDNSGRCEAIVCLEDELIMVYTTPMPTNI